MKYVTMLLVSLLLVAPASAREQLLAPGLYRSAAGDFVYVGVGHELPDAAVNESFDARTQRLYSTFPQPLRLVTAVQENRRVIRAPQGSLGVSLWYVDESPHPAIILIHGNDPERREMGFLIPFFAANGLDVITYDQRGTGESAGSWSQNGPVQRAYDVEAIFDAFATDPRIDRAHVGVWGFSNGGWTAPIVAAHRPLAFMILKSAPAESLEVNIMYEVTQRMHEYHFYGAAVDDALAAWRVLIASIDGRASWQSAKKAYVASEKKPWFEAAFLPAHLTFPLPAETEAALRRAVIYDPLPTLRTVRTPTLALFGALDRNVDVRHAAPTFASAFARAGMTDFTERVYPNAGHSLEVSRTGFNGDAQPPERFVPGYPSVMIDWLRQRGDLTQPAAQR